MNKICILAPHRDDEFFAYMALKKAYGLGVKKQEIKTIFMTDSAETKFLENETDPIIYSYKRKEESKNFCSAFNIDILYDLNKSDGTLCFEDIDEITKIINYYIKECDVLMIPAIMEHEDHDATSNIGEYLSEVNDIPLLIYTVHAKNTDGIWKYFPYSNDSFNVLVDCFYFWYPSQKKNFFPSFYSGYLKETL